MTDMLPVALDHGGMPLVHKGKLAGNEKAAVLLISIGPDRAAEVFKHLKDDEIEALSLQMAKTRQIPQETTEAVWTELVELIMADSYVAEGGVDYARDVLERSPGEERAWELIGRL